MDRSCSLFWVVGCSTSAPSADPSQTPLPTSLSSAPATPAPTPELALGPGAVAEVVTDDLVMRTGPAIAPESEIYPGRLGPGDRLYLVDGPVEADGYDWYLADPYQTTASGDHWLRFGWVAAADTNGEAWIVPIAPTCPAEASIASLNQLPRALRLACFGDQLISIEGDVACLALETIPTPTPAWLTWDGCYLIPPGAPPDDLSGPGPHLGIWIHYPPGAERLTGSLRVAAHLDDDRAAECMLHVPVEKDDPYTQDLVHREQQLACRASLVVDDAVPGTGSD